MDTCARWTDSRKRHCPSLDAVVADAIVADFTKSEDWILRYNWLSGEEQTLRSASTQATGIFLGIEAKSWREYSPYNNELLHTVPIVYWACS